jgi:hypothetical protein
MRRFLSFLVLALGAITPLQIRAQHGRAPTRVPAVLVLVDSSATSGEPFQVLRRASVEPHDVILLAQGADAWSLSAAVRQLVLLRRMQGDTSSATGPMRIRGAPTTHAAGPLPWAARVIEDLRNATARRVAGIGTAPAVQIWLPPQRRARPQAELRGRPAGTR